MSRFGRDCRIFATGVQPGLVFPVLCFLIVTFSFSADAAVMAGKGTVLDTENVLNGNSGTVFLPVSKSGGLASGSQAAGAGLSVSECSPQPVMIMRTTPVYFPVFQNAYDEALENEIIEVRARDLAESLLLSRDIPVTLKGGYDCNFTSNNQSTTIDSLTIVNGAVTIENVALGITVPAECVIDQPQMNLTAGNIISGNQVIQSFVMNGLIQMVDVMFGTYGRANTKEIIFHLKDDLNSEIADLAVVRVNASQLDNNNWHRFEFTPVKSSKGTQYYIVLESPESSMDDSVTAWVSSGDPYPGGHLWQESGSTAQDLAFRVFTVSAGNGIEYFAWLDLTPDHWDRKIYRSNVTDISMTFGDRAIMEGGFYEHFFTYNFYDMFDYFCIPDDLIISYDDSFSSWVRAYGLNWTVHHGLLEERQKAFLRHQYNAGDGYNPLTSSINKGSGILPPADITVQHDMTYSENYVPMTIKIRNRHDQPLRFIYVFQDGAWMTQGEPNQKDVHQYWDDGEYEFSRAWYIDDSNRANKNNWVGMYNDRNGGMFAATYAPPESAGIRYHATWNKLWSEVFSSSAPGQVNSLDPFGYAPSRPDWFKYENLLSNIDTTTPLSPYDNTEWKWHGTVIDFGTLQPNEERTQIIVKIMFTGYINRIAMHDRLRSIISRIPTYALDGN
ncbi:MAG: hypothetical protein C0402_06405 [Thermodesulfovibrio sp.]|nr:hypothetical protein [Thermodesulfovibrio sp.]